MSIIPDKRGLGWFWIMWTLLLIFLKRELIASITLDQFGGVLLELFKCILDKKDADVSASESWWNFMNGCELCYLFYLKINWY